VCEFRCGVFCVSLLLSDGDESPFSVLEVGVLFGSEAGVPFCFFSQASCLVSVTSDPLPSFAVSGEVGFLVRPFFVRSFFLKCFDLCYALLFGESVLSKSVDYAQTYRGVSGVHWSSGVWCSVFVHSMRVQWGL